MNTAWLLLVIAGVLEVGWAIGLKYTDGFNFRGRPLACSATLVAMIASMYLLSVAVRTIPIGTGYAIWTGIGALGAATLGMLFFREPATAGRIACLLMVVLGIIGLKLTSPAAAQEPSTHPIGSADMIPFYIGGYSGPNNKGIYRSALDARTGQLSEPMLAAEMRNPSFLAQHPTLPLLGAAGEVGKGAGNVTAFTMNADGTLAAPVERSSRGDSPCHVSIDPAGRFAFTANYGDGVIAALPLNADGTIGEASFVDAHAGSSADPKRQTGPHAHSVVPDPSGRFAISADLGTDELIVYAIDKPAVSRVHAVKLPPGSGPRHTAFSADGKFVYVCTEMANTLATFSFDASNGSLEMLDVQATLPADFTGKSSTAEVAVHPSGGFVYVSNRGHDSLAIFMVDQASGRAKPTGHVSTGGKEPRHFAIEPSGRFLIVANNKSDDLVAFTIDEQTGVPSPTGSRISIGAPSCVRFAR